MIDPEELIRVFDLAPHPEGGHFRESYRAQESFLLQSDQKARSACTGIYFLLRQKEFSSFHRLQSDEMWHFYLGGPLAIVELGMESIKTTILGTDFKRGQLLQYVVAAHTWFASYPCAESSFSFVGCTVSPGFDFADFEMAERNSLLRQFPHASTLVEQLTPAIKK